MRPGVHKFLNELKDFYEIVIFTASVQDYADWIIDSIDQQCFVSQRLYRHYCVYEDGMYM